MSQSLAIEEKKPLYNPNDRFLLTASNYCTMALAVNPLFHFLMKVLIFSWSCLLPFNVLRDMISSSPISLASSWTGVADCDCDVVGKPSEVWNGSVSFRLTCFGHVPHKAHPSVLRWAITVRWVLLCSWSQAGLKPCWMFLYLLTVHPPSDTLTSEQFFKICFVILFFVQPFSLSLHCQLLNQLAISHISQNGAAQPPTKGSPAL